MRLGKKARKDFDPGTVVIQTPSFTTSTDYGDGYFILLCNFPVLKTSIFKISETLPHHGSANHCTIVDEFSWVTVHNVSRGLRASGPLGRPEPRASGPLGLRAAGPLGHRGPWAAGRWAVGLLLAKPISIDSSFVHPCPYIAFLCFVRVLL